MEMESGKIRAWPHFIHETSRHASKSEKIHETSKVMFFLEMDDVYPKRLQHGNFFEAVQ